MENVTVDMLPARLAYRDRAEEVAAQCMREVQFLGRMMDAQRLSRGRKSLRPELITKRAKALMEAHLQALDVSRQVAVEYLDGEGNRQWVLPQVPPLVGSSMVQDPRIMTEGIGDWHKLYRGKYRQYYGKK